MKACGGHEATGIRRGRRREASLAVRSEATSLRNHACRIEACSAGGESNGVGGFGIGTMPSARADRHGGDAQ